MHNNSKNHYSNSSVDNLISIILAESMIRAVASWYSFVYALIVSISDFIFCISVTASR